MKLKTDPRHAARELALSSIFCWLFSEQSEFAALETSKELLELDQEEQELLETLVSGVKSNIDKIDKIIEDAAPEWPLEKISKVDLVILRIAIFEIAFSKMTPVKVAIDEAVELAKEYGNDTSHKFINGVLGTVADNLNKK